MKDTEDRTAEAEAAEGTETLVAETASGPATVDGSTSPEKPQTEREKPKNEQSQETPEGERRKAPEYEIIPPKQEMPETGFVTYPLLSALTDEDGKKGAAARREKLARLSKASLERIQKTAPAQTKVYAAAGIGMGLLAGLIVAVLLLHPNSATGANDMGSVDGASYGLKGRLTTSWNGHLQYRLTLEPMDANRAADFAANVNRSPKPLAIEVQAKDPFGAVMCSDTILLKFDPRNAPEMEVRKLGPDATKAQIALSQRDQIARGLALAKLEGQELDREHGQNLFQNDADKNGQLASISAQGVLPCTKKQFENFVSWGFTGNFPAVVQTSPNIAPETALAKRAETKNAAARNREKRKQASPLSPIYVEGDDAIAWIDAPNGVIGTRGGKELRTDKSDAIAATLKGEDLPIPIHYRCDQEGNCTFSGGDRGVHHARLRR
jgi:hypothetical protein